MPTYTAPLPPTRATGNTPTGGVAADVNSIVTAIGEVRTALTTEEGAAVHSTSIDTIVTITQAAYDALTPAATALYIITD